MRSTALKPSFSFQRLRSGGSNTILKKLGIEGHKDVVLIDARNDNKPSGSKA